MTVINNSPKGMSLFDIEHESLLRDLQSHGFLYGSINNLINEKTEPYKEAGPILIKHLKKAKDMNMIGAIARALTSRSFPEAAETLFQRYKELSDRDYTNEISQAMWELGLAMTKTGLAENIIEACELIRNKNLKSSRQTLVEALCLVKYRKYFPLIEDSLIPLLNDAYINIQVTNTLGKIGGEKSLHALKIIQDKGLDSSKWETVTKRFASRYTLEELEELKINGDISPAFKKQVPKAIERIKKRLKKN